MATITVFTPAYNRGHTITRTYESLKKQNNKDFVWLVVDDGSSDNTADLVKMWQKEEKTFEIKYVYKENGGMHTAHNTAYENIDTELNVCIDSDDCLADNAIELILNKWASVRDMNYAGIIGLDADFSGKVLGTGFSKDMSETTLSGYYAAGGTGDKKLVYRTDVVKKYPSYPVFEGEKYVALAYLYRLIDRDYKLAVLDEVLCNVEYQGDGSSATMYKQYVKNPKGFAFWRRVCMENPESKKRLIIDNVHYVSSCIFAKDKELFKKSPTKLLTFLSLLPGVALNVYIRLKVKK